jgi:valyl-tRNA synthetase
VTGRDIIFLWVSRMVMTGMKFMGEKPFDDVIIHGTVLDKNGQRMSKTKNNGIDPLSVFEKYGVDATRMTLAGSATGIDFAWRDERVESFRNFANKIWNATRFCLMNAKGPANFSLPTETANLSLPDRWIISRLNETAKAVNRALETYQFHEAVQLLYHFFWDEFCDWYIELVKDEITLRERETERRGDAEIENPQSAIRDPQSEALGRILSILEQALRLLHPFMPFLTEELWLKLPGVSNALHNPAYLSAEPTIMLTSFPTGDDTLIDEHAESEMQSVIELITKVRNIRAEMNIKSGDPLSIHVAGDGAILAIFAANESQIKKLARADKIVLTDLLDVPKASARAVLAGNAEVAIPLEGLIDFDKERARLEGQIEKLDVELQRLNAQLANSNFVEKAPQDKVDQLRERQIEIDVQMKTLSGNLEAIE